MNCRDFELLSISDDAAERESAARHAAACTTCAATLVAHERLLDEAAAWRDGATAPPELEARVRRSLERTGVEIAQARGSSGKLLPGRWLTSRLAVRAALAASLVTALAVGWSLVSGPTAPEHTRRLLAAEALEAAETAEREHARAIARLEVAAAPYLALASHAETDPEEVGRLLALADQLAFLDSTIEQVSAFVQENSTHPQARVTLLAAYREKTAILSEILALETRS